MTILALITDALSELGVLGAGQTASGALADLGLRTLNRRLDNWNSKRQAVYASVLAEYTLTPNLQPHTIGSSSATFTVTQRPVSIEAANILIDTIRYPLALRNARWWMGLSDPELTAERPTDLYYEPAWPNGQLYLWPEPTSARTLELLSRVLLVAVTLNGTFTMPQGYELAVMLTLAEDLRGPLGRPVDGDLSERARLARADIFANNDPTPNLITRDAGMPGAGEHSTWDYRVGRLV